MSNMNNSTPSPQNSRMSMMNSEVIREAHEAFERQIAARRRPADVTRAASSPEYTVPETERLTPFHSRCVPQCSLWRMASIIARTIKADDVVLAAALVLVQRYDSRAPRNQRVSEHMLHRLYCACLQVALKAHSDVFYNNQVYAKAVGVTLREMNVLEWALVDALKWHIQVTAEQIDAVLHAPFEDDAEEDERLAVSPLSRSLSPAVTPDASPRRFPVRACAATMADSDFRPHDHLVSSNDALSS